MAWTMSANLRGSYVPSDLGDHRCEHKASWTSFLTSLRALANRSTVGQFGGRTRTWVLRFIVLGHLTLLTVALSGGSGAAIQTAIVATGLLLCLAFLLPDAPSHRGKKATTNETVDLPSQQDQETSANPTYQLSSPNIAQAFCNQTTTPGQAWTDLASRVSHELRTPLNAVIGFSDLMERELHGPLGCPQYNEYTRHISDSGRALLKSAEDTLAVTSALARLDAPATTQTIELCEIVQSAWSHLQQEANQRGVTFIVRAERDLTVVCDRLTQKQILINLLGDALRSSLDNATVIFSATLDGNSVMIEITATDVSLSLPCEDSLDLCLARALLEVQDAPLTVIHKPKGTRRLQTCFQADLQQELFF
ncbi:MAG: sensor histidine kinase [Hyphomicrobiaceae bacterium]